MSQPGATDRPPIPHAACSSSRLKGASWSTHSVLGRLRKSFVCLRAHSALKQTLDFETAPGTAGATTQGGGPGFPTHFGEAAGSDPGRGTGRRTHQTAGG